MVPMFIVHRFNSAGEPPRLDRRIIKLDKVVNRNLERALQRHRTVSILEILRPSDNHLVLLYEEFTTITKFDTSKKNVYNCAWGLTFVLF